jgi:hypothetical protein
MKLQLIARMSFAAMLVAVTASAQNKPCGHREKCAHERCCEESGVTPHYHGPRIFRNTRYDNSYKHRNFSHQHSAYKSNWERRPYVDPRK